MGRKLMGFWLLGLSGCAPDAEVAPGLAKGIGYLVGFAFGIAVVQFAIRFVLLRFVSRKAASLIAAVLAIVGALSAGDFGLGGLVCSALILIAQMAREPPKQAG